ncbi:unnamed protein product, partial [Rotaria magnacalcarata]
PYHLTCDYSAKRLYWTDGALSRIQHSDYNGRNIQSLRGRLISHPFGLAIYGCKKMIRKFITYNKVKLS